MDPANQNMVVLQMPPLAFHA